RRQRADLLVGQSVPLLRRRERDGSRLRPQGSAGPAHQGARRPRGSHRAHPSGRWFATGAAREHVRLWTIDGTLVAERKFPDKIVTPVGSAFALAFSGDGQHLVVGTSNRTETIQILDLNARLGASTKTSHSVVNAGSLLS